MRISTWLAAMAAASVLLVDVSAWAGQPQPWQLGLQDAATPQMGGIHFLHNLLLGVITGIVILVLALLLYVTLRFNVRRNPQPSKVTHNTPLEIVWTVIPALILVVIAVYSFPLLYALDRVPEEADVTVKVTGYQWYWVYQYPDLLGDLEFDAHMVAADDLGIDAFGDRQPRLLATTQDMVVPVGKTIKVQVTSADVLHSWAVPAFGIKIDAVPGRLNEISFTPQREGMFYGQCSELCGINHAFMPIAVRVVSEKDLEAWIDESRELNGIASAAPAADVAAK